MKREHDSGPGRDTSVATYYADLTDWLIKITGDLRTIHLGLWGGGTVIETEEDAQMRSIHVLVEGCGLGPGKQVLDAGCGLGGPAVTLAKEYGVHITGLTNCETHIAVATEFAARHGVDHLVEFRHGDFMDMPFPDASFDIVINHESFCYAPDKLAYLQGVNRVLKPTGHWRMADPVLSGKPMSKAQQAILVNVQRGYRIPPWAELREVLALLEQAGFEMLWERNLDDEVLPETGRRSKWWKLVVFLTPPPKKPEELSLHEFMQSTVDFDQLLREGVFTYRLISGTKPG